MTDFKWRHYQGGVIHGCVRWYCKYGISYRELDFNPLAKLLLLRTLYSLLQKIDQNQHFLLLTKDKFCEFRMIYGQVDYQTVSRHIRFL